MDAAFCIAVAGFGLSDEPDPVRALDLLSHGIVTELPDGTWLAIAAFDALATADDPLDG
ncbi:hypothetical protein [Actinomadura fibrosa]|uniref:Uncharacterized protein n=1 Tax=Actinomadura fibrosa TaxID=111802 RepID=A0ABW2Y5H6_9ACTN|nr:hypothetical protein [Actinomadura fibrosa]